MGKKKARRKSTRLQSFSSCAQACNASLHEELLLGDGRHDGRLGSGGRDGLLLLLLLAASENGNGRKSKNRDGLHIYLTWYIVKDSPSTVERLSLGLFYRFFGAIASPKSKE